MPEAHSGRSADASLTAAVLAAVAVPVYVVTPEGHIPFANAAFRQLLGYEDSDLQWLRIWDIDMNLSQSLWPRAWTLAGERAVGMSTRVRCKDGAAKDVELTVVKGQIDGQPAGVVAIVRVAGSPGPFEDIADWSDRATLGELEQVYRLAPVGLFAIDRQYRFLRLNDRMAAIQGGDVASQIGKTLSELVPDLAPGLVETYAPVLERGEAVLDVEVRGETPAEPGRVRDWLCSYYPLRAPGGEIAGLVGAVLDVTDRREAEAQRRLLESRLEQAQRLESLGVLAGGIAHDFNNLLVAIVGNASLALADLDPAHPATESVQRIEAASQRAADLVKQMLAYSGRGRMVIEPVDVSAVLRDVANLLHTVISKRASMRLALADGLPTVEADVTQLRQIAMNLVTNASDAIGDHSGTITLATGALDADARYLAGSLAGAGLAEGRYVFLEVSDTGCGMDQATLERIFDPFFSTKFVGRGLGLSAVLGIVKSHRGAIKVYSEVGRGTSVKVLLPAVAAPASATRLKPSTDVAVVGLGRRVLVVDDDPQVRATAKRILERAGFAVLEATDGLDALSEVRREDDIAVVLLDLTMPRMGGAEALTELRRFRPQMPVVLSSGYNAEDAMSRFAGKGLAGFVQKPYRSKELIATIAAALR